MKETHARHAVSLAVVLMVAGCATPPHPPGIPTGPESVSLQAFSRNPFQSVTLPGSRMQRHEEAIKALGPPSATLTKDTPNAQDPTIIDSVITLRYTFGELLYLHVSGKNLENLILIQLHGNQIALKYGIRFGETTREQIQKLFGPAQHTEANSLSYDVRYAQEMTNSTTFYFKDRVLIQVDIASLMMD